MDCSPPGSLAYGIFQQEYCRGWPFPPPGDLPDPGVKPTPPISLHCQADSLTMHHLGSQIYLLGYLIAQLMDVSVATNFIGLTYYITYYITYS